MQRLWELGRSRRNEVLLKSMGGREHARGQMPWMRALHATWLVAMPLDPVREVEGLLVQGQCQGLAPVAQQQEPAAGPRHAHVKQMLAGHLMGEVGEAGLVGMGQDHVGPLQALGLLDGLGEHLDCQRGGVVGVDGLLDDGAENLSKMLAPFNWMVEKQLKFAAPLGVWQRRRSRPA